MAARILYVSPQGFIGGAERSLLVLLEALDRSRFTPLVVTFEDGPLVERVRRAGVAVEVVPLPMSLLAATQRYRGYSAAEALRLAAGAVPVVSRLRSRILALGAAVVHTNGIKAHVVGGLAGGLARVPVVWHLRDFPHHGATGRFLRALARVIPAHVIVNSDAVGASLGRGRRVTTVHNGVNLHAFTPGVDGTPFRRACGIAPEAPLVGLVAHLTPWKGHLVFLEACALIGAARPDCRFAIVGAPVYGTEGHGGYAAEVRGAVTRLGLEGRVVFSGFQEDMPVVMRGLDVLVHASSEAEPFGRTLIEAMAAGRPVVATAGGGVDEVVADGHTGYLVPPVNPRALGEVVLRLLEDPGLRDKLGSAGRERAKALFSAERHAAGIEAVYGALLDARRGHR